jgi:hypothetical protein
LDSANAIDAFFQTADPLAQKERELVVEARIRSEKRLYEKGKVEDLDFRRFGRNLVGSYAAPAPRPNTTSSKKGMSELGRLMNDTSRLERELTGVYSKILTVGKTLNAREDGLLQAKYSGGDAGPGTDGSRPSTAPTKGPHRSRNSVTGGCGDYVKKPAKQIAEIDELLSLTDDVLKIENFLHKYSFERILQADDEELLDPESDLQIGSHEVLKDLSSMALITTRDIAPSPRPTSATPKMHPIVEAYVNKHCTTKIVPVAPGTRRIKDDGSDELLIGTPASRENLAANIIREIAAVQALHGDRPPSPLPSGPCVPSDLTSKVLKCRESLLTLRTQAQMGMSMDGFMWSPGTGGGPPEPGLKSSRSSLTVKSSRRPKTTRVKYHVRGDGGSGESAASTLTPPQQPSPSASSTKSVVSKNKRM